MRRVSTRIPKLPQRLREAAEWRTFVADLPPPAELDSRTVGEVVTDRRTSWVRRLRTASGTIFLKTYEYGTWASRLRDFGHRTGPWSTPRPAREFDALVWLRAHGFAAPRPLAAWAFRRWGFVVRTTLVTEAHPGQAASELLPQLEQRARIAAAQAIGTFVRQLHALGFRDRNLDLRNLLLTFTNDRWVVAKIDSPRFRLRHPGTTDDDLARADWQRLDPQLAVLGLLETVHAAAAGVVDSPS